MNKYLVSIRIKSQVVKTIIYADSPIHAKLLGEWHYGIGSVANTPTQVKENQPTKPPTPEQTRINNLKNQLTQAKQVEKQNKLNQQQIKLNQQRASLNK